MEKSFFRRREGCGAILGDPGQRTTNITQKSNFKCSQLKWVIRRPDILCSMKWFTLWAVPPEESATQCLRCSKGQGGDDEPDIIGLNKCPLLVRINEYLQICLVHVSSTFVPQSGLHLGQNSYVYMVPLRFYGNYIRLYQPCQVRLRRR